MRTSCTSDGDQPSGGLVVASAPACLWCHAEGGRSTTRHALLADECAAPCGCWLKIACRLAAAILISPMECRLGSRLSDAAAELHAREGLAYYGQTVHPRFGRYRDRSALWRPTLWNHSTQRYKVESWKQRAANTRVKLRKPRFVYSHVYVGVQGGDEAGLLKGRVVVEE